ncbi:MAG: PAS domain S-box protein [Nitrospirae bacterium]|nr:PAS domain S-box protein [Nitrospirota bacterium]
MVNEKTSGSEKGDSHLSFRIAIWIFVVMYACIGLSGYILFDFQKKHIKENKQKELSDIVTRRANRIVARRKEFLHEASLVHDFMALALYTVKNTKYRTPELQRTFLSSCLESIKKSYNVSRVLLTDSEGKVVLSTEGSNAINNSIGRIAMPVFKETIKAKRITLSDIYRDSNNMLTMAVVIPVLSKDYVKDDKTGDVSYAIIYDIDPYRELFPLIQDWQTEISTAETFLIRSEGNDVLYLKDFHYIKNSATAFRLSIDKNNRLPAAMALSGKQGIVEGYDYRGVPVVAAIMAIPDTPWFIVSKLDKEEIYKPIRTFARLEGMIVSLLLAFSGTGIGLLWYRKRAGIMKKYYESDESFRRIFEDSPVGIILVDKNQNIVNVNKKFCQMLEYTADEMKKLSILDVTHPDDVKSSIERNEKLFENNKIIDAEKRYITKYGKSVWVKLNASQVTDGKGKALYAIGMAVDITENLQKQEDLERNHAFTEAILDCIEDGIIAIDSEGVLRLFNKAMQRFHGITSEPENANEWTKLYDSRFNLYLSDGKTKMQRQDFPLFKVLWGDDVTNMEMIIAPKTAPSYTVLATGRMLRDKKGNEIGAVVSFHNVTELKNAEKQWENTFNSMTDLIMILDPGYKIIKVNKAFALKMGKTQEELVGLTCYEQVHGLREPRSGCPHGQMLADGKTHECEIYEERLNGYYLVSVTPLLNTIGELIGSMHAAKDITKRKSLEEDLIESNKHNESMVKDLNILLKEIHHRVKNNLQIISSLLSLQADRISDTNFQNIFKDSQNRIKTMALVHEKLYRSSNLAEIDVAEYIQDLSSELFYSYNAYPDAIELRFDIGVVSIDVDLIITCGLVINELLSNALKYAFPIGIKGRITISFNRTPDDKYMLIVSDDGVGIPEQCDIKNTESLGLQLVNDLITRKLKGKIELDRTVGTKFTMIF